MTSKTINVKAIRIDGGTQSRVEIDNDLVAEYAEAIKAKAKFPPMVVFHDGVDYWLADGFHRWHAYNAAGKASVDVDVRDGSMRQAILFGLGANDEHGKRPTNADKRKSVLTMLNDKEWAAWSQQKIALTCKVSAGFVSKMVGELASIHGEEIKPSVRTVERAGKTYVQDTTNIGVKQHREVAKAAHEADIARGGNGTNGAKMPVSEPPPVDPEDEYTELDAAHDQIEALQSMLAVASMGNAPDEDKEMARNLIAELRAEIKTLRATLKAVTQSRDSLMNEVAQVKRQCMSQQRELKSLKAADHA